MYQSDSFFTLSIPGQIGLACLTLVLSVAAMLLVLKLTWHRAWWWRVLIAGGLFLGFLWLSPQIYYTYYRAIIPGLPLQVVISTWPDPIEALRLLMFSDGSNLSAHGRGVLGWAMLITSALRRTG